MEAAAGVVFFPLRIRVGSDQSWVEVHYLGRQRCPNPYYGHLKAKYIRCSDMEKEDIHRTVILYCFTYVYHMPYISVSFSPKIKKDNASSDGTWFCFKIMMDLVYIQFFIFYFLHRKVYMYLTFFKFIRFLPFLFSRVLGFTRIRVIDIYVFH